MIGSQVIEVLEMVIAQLESRSCRDQLILLMFEPQSADLIYCLLLNKTFSMDLKHRALKVSYSKKLMSTNCESLIYNKTFSKPDRK